MLKQITPKFWRILDIIGIASLSIVFFLIPFHFDIFLYSSNLLYVQNMNAIVGGSFLDISELFLLIAIIIFIILSIAKYKRPKTNNHISFLLFFAIALFAISFIVSTIYAPDKILHLLLLRYWIYGFLLIWVVLRFPHVIEYIVWGLLISSLFQSLIAIIQVLINGKLGIGFLGESNISSLSPDTARIRIGDVFYVRGYGTTFHPNILSFFLSMSFFIGLFKFDEIKKHIGKLYTFFLFSIIFIGILATISKTAYFLLGVFITLSIVIIIYKKSIGQGKDVDNFFTLNPKKHFKILEFVKNFFYKNTFKKIISNISKKAFIFLLYLFAFASIIVLGYLIYESIFIFFNPNTISDRMNLNFAALYLILHNPTGVGLGNFPLLLNSVPDLLFAPWEIQPVHNIFLLITSELGLFGGVAIIMLFIQFIKSSATLIRKSLRLKYLFLILSGVTILMFGMFDHLVISTWLGLIIFCFFIAILEHEIT